MSKESLPQDRRPKSLLDTYDFGDSTILRPVTMGLGQNPSYEENRQVQGLVDDRRVSHPNIARLMTTTGGQLNRDKRGDLPVSRNEIVQSVQQGKLFVDHDRISLDQASGKLRQDAEEIDLSMDAIGQIDQQIEDERAKPKLSFLKRNFGYDFDNPEIRVRNLQKDRMYLMQRALWLAGVDIRDKEMASHATIHPDSVVAAHDRLEDNYLAKKRDDGSTNRDELIAYHYDLAHSEDQRRQKATEQKSGTE